MPHSVLIVSHSREWRSSLVRHFETGVFQAVECTRFDEAERLVSIQRFSVAVVDFISGSENGWRLCRRIAVHQEITDLIIVSEKQSPFIEHAIQLLSPVYYFVKPCSLEDIAAAIRKTCEWRSSKEQQKQQVLQWLHDLAAKRAR